MTKSYQDRVEMRDGDVVLFKRPDVKRPVWQMRLHVRGMKDLQGNPLPYIQASTGEVDLDEAKHIAQAKHDELKLKVRNKEPARDVTGFNFGNVGRRAYACVAHIGAQKHQDGRTDCDRNVSGAAMP